MTISKKKKKFFILLLIVVLSFYVILRINFHSIVKKTLYNNLNIETDFKSINFMNFGKLKLKKVVIKSKSGEELVKAREVIIDYNLSDLKHINSIVAKNAVINIRLYDNRKKVSIVDPFINLGKGPKSTEDKGKKKVRLDMILAVDSTLNYIDETFEDPVIKQLKSVDGAVLFDENNNIEIKANGTSKQERYEFKLTKNKGENLNFELNAVEVNIDNNIMQYAYRKEDLSFEKGRADVTIQLTDNGIEGICDFRGVKIDYQDLKNPIEHINGNAVINTKNVEVNATGLVQKNKVGFQLNYDTAKQDLHIKIDTKNLNYKVFENYKILEKLEFPVKGMIQNAELNLNYDVAENKFSIGIVANTDRLFINGYELNNINAAVSYIDDEWKIKKIQFEHDEEINENINVKGKTFLNGTFSKGEFNGKFILSDQKSNLDIDKLYGEINFSSLGKALKVKIYNKDRGLHSQLSYFQDGQINININAQKPIYLNYENEKIKFLGKTEISYDIKNSNLLYGNYDIKLFGLMDTDKISLAGTVQENKFNLKKVYIVKNDSYTYLVGKYNLENKKYDFKIIQTQFRINEFVKELKSEIWVHGYGNIKGQDKHFILESTLESDEGNYIFDYEFLTGDIVVEYDGKDFEIRGKSNLKKLGYKNQFVRDIALRYYYKDKMLYLDKFSNNILTITGNYNIIDQSIDFDYDIKNYKIKEIVFLEGYDISGDISKISGKIKNTIKNPRLTMSIADAAIKYKDAPSINIKGDFELEDYILSLKKVYLNENMLSGTYNIQNQKIEAKLNILEKKAGEYYKFENTSLNFQAIGEINIWGNLNNISALGKLSAKNIYYGGYECPDIYTRFTYTRGDILNLFKTGVLNFSEIVFLDKNDLSIMQASAYLDLINQETEINIENQEIDINKFNYIYPDKTLKGKLKVNFNLKSDLRKVEYKSEIISDEIKIGDILIKDISNKFKGNEKEFYVENISMNYNGNPLNFYGKLELDPLKYNFRLFATNVDLAFLNLFLNDKIRDVTGKADMNLVFNENESRGSLILENFGFKTLDEEFDFENINSKLIFEKQKININKLSGEINNGTFDANGYISLPQFKDKIEDFREIDDSGIFVSRYDYLKNVESDINIQFNNIMYYYDKIIKLDFSGNLRVRNRDITGNLDLNSGEIRGIPKQKNDKKDGEGILSLINLDINFLIKDELQIVLEKFSIIEDIEANIEGGGKLKLQEEKFSFIGTISTEKGVVTVQTLNNNYFEINSGTIVFDNPYQYFPDVNPSIAISASTEIASETIYVDINGYYKNLNYMVRSDNENLSPQDIASLLAFHSPLKESSPQGVVIDLLENHLKNSVFDPISQKLQEVFSLSKVKVYSDLLKQEGEEITITEDFRLGATVELKDVLYKDLVFWNLKVKMSSDDPGELDYYDIWLDYKIREYMSISLGTKQQQKSETETEGNLHIDLEFKKRYRKIF